MKEITQNRYDISRTQSRYCCIIHLWKSTQNLINSEGGVIKTVALQVSNKLVLLILLLFSEGVSFNCEILMSVLQRVSDDAPASNELKLPYSQLATSNTVK